MKDLGLMHYLLGLEFQRKPREIFLSQGKYVVKILERFVNTLSQHMVEPHHSHWIGAKNLLRYLRGTITHGLRYTARDLRLHGYTNVEWAGSVVDQKSTFGCYFSLGSASISWMSRKQNSMALSTIEVEYIAASMASYEVVWLRKLFSEMFEFTLDTIVILCDN
eukprot:PITA_10047